MVLQHTHHTTLNVENKLKFAIILSAFILIVEVVGGFLSNSLALLSDAGHVFADVMALSLSLYGVRQAKRPASSRMTFGYHRVGVIIAIVNAFSIFAIAGIIIYEAYSRFVQPVEVKSLLMLSVAFVGLAVNTFVAFWLHTEQKGNLNVRSAFWHALGDALASIGVIIGGAVILFTDWFWVDPVVSVFISVIIFLAAWQILREGFRVLLEAAPSGMGVAEIVHTIKQVPGVKDVHDVHLWSISPEIHAMSCHILIDDVFISQVADIRKTIEDVVRERFNIRHTTIQVECQKCDPGDVLCNLNHKSCEDNDQHQPT